MLIAAPYSLSAHERGQLGLVDYLVGSGDVWGSRLKAEGRKKSEGRAPYVAYAVRAVYVRCRRAFSTDGASKTRTVEV